MTASDDPFWTWSLEVYARPGVEQVLLDLQDRLGLDVNILLYACWVAANRQPALSVSECERLLAETADWRGKVIVPLRGVRRFLKGQEAGTGIVEMRERAKSLELEAEQIMQSKIVRFMTDRKAKARPNAHPVGAALAGLEACLEAGGIVVTNSDRDLLSSLACACSD
jgi:uncharacterized protein (TIGR02444 family)